MTAIRIILATAAICFAIAWFNTGDFLWYGVGCLISAVLFFVTLGAGEDAGWMAMDGWGDGGGGDGGGDGGGGGD